ncbi:MAG TPA: hypothetical protein VHH73_19860 [Verrucomicrobiae bacterium]|nr:hypothetical protein [Verrucomicrobiae bacterium]
MPFTLALIALSAGEMTPLAAQSLPSVAGVGNSNNTNSNEAGLRNRIDVLVTQYSILAAAASNAPILLYLDGMAMTGLVPEAIVPLTPTNAALPVTALRYHLQINDTNKGPWIDILSRPKHFLQNLPVSVGLPRGIPLPALNNTPVTINFVLLSPARLLIWIFLLIVILWYFFRLATHTAILRDPAVKLPDTQKPYSTARTQLAFWFFVILV